MKRFALALFLVTGLTLGVSLGCDKTVEEKKVTETHPDGSTEKHQSKTTADDNGTVKKTESHKVTPPDKN